MRTAMKERTKEMHQRLSERRKRADQLVEKWSKVKNIGEGLIEAYDKNPDKIRGLAIILENQEKHLKSLTETQISNAFQTTPQNVMKIVRLGYPNSVRGEIFLEWPMETARDSIYYLSPVYASSKRGATAGDITHQSGGVYRYASEMEEDTMTGTVDGVNTVFTGSNGGNLGNPPVRPFTVKILLDDVIVATDDGSGNLVGSALDASGTNTVNYTTGAITVTFATPPATGSVVKEQYFYDSEVDTQYTDLGEVELQLKDYLFRAKPWPLGVSWSKMTELLLGTTLDIDAEEALIRGAADEVKKSLDAMGCREGYRYAKGNATITFDADFASAGADSEVAHAQSITRKIDDAGAVIYNVLNRGGVTKIYGGSKAMNYLKLHRRFNAEGMQPKVGIFKIGSLDGMDLYQTPSTVVPENELVCVYKNDLVPEDVSISWGTLIPLYQTQTLEFKNQYKETGLAFYGDYKALEPRYLVRLVLENL